MNEIQIYSALMFLAGVALTHAVFYFDKKSKNKRFFIFLSASILQVLENISLTHEASIEYISEQLKNIEESQRRDYLEKERQKLAALMELYVLLFRKSVPPEGRKFVNFKNWPEAKALINELKGFLKNEQGKG